MDQTFRWNKERVVVQGFIVVPRDRRRSSTALSHVAIDASTHLPLSIGYINRPTLSVQGVLAALLSAPYLVQRLGDFDPGLEFKTAMVYADASKRFSQPAAATAVAAAATAAVAGQADTESSPSLDASEDAGEGNGAARSPREAGATAAMAAEATGAGGLGPGECTIVLGDRDVQETLRRLGGALTALTGRQTGKENGEGAAGGGGGRSGGGIGLVGAAAGDVRDVKLEVSGREVLGMAALLARPPWERRLLLHTPPVIAACRGVKSVETFGAYNLLFPRNALARDLHAMDWRSKRIAQTARLRTPRTGRREANLGTACVMTLPNAAHGNSDSFRHDSATRLWFASL